MQFQLDDKVKSINCQNVDEYNKKLIVANLKALSTFKEYFDELYGKGLEIENWNLNGDTQPFDDFYDEALSEMNKIFQDTINCDNQQ